ncbi:hypothetical protein JX265_005154 [Neoarthrinium moseri]|uniref:Ankyrin n=1 Tax=Neoarthrinium moseri TaxID=1658444 RepID=A0A9Q0AN24_9PEZI|nr:hypothetical protein JX265_005154 [Neoarthrinium moseri]
MNFAQIIQTGRTLTALEEALLSSSQILTNIHSETPEVNDAEEHPTGEQRLPDHILLRTAKFYLHQPRDIMSLALASKQHWRLLEMEIYIADVLKTKQQENDAILREKIQLPITLEALMNTQLVSIPVAAQRHQLFQLRPDLRIKETALHHAAVVNNKYAAKKAVIASAKFWPGYVDVKRYGCVPLMLAVIRNSTNAAQVLVESGCYIDAWHKEPKGARKLVAGGCEFVANLEVRNGFYDKNAAFLYTPLCMAIAKRLPSLSLLLAQNSTDSRSAVEDLRRTPMSPLHLAAFAGMSAVVAALLQRGYRREDPSPAFLGAEPLGLAASGVDNNIATLELLLDLDKSNPDEQVSYPWAGALAHRVPHNAIYLLENHHRGRRISDLTREARQCLEADDLLPVLRWILENNDSAGIRSLIRERCNKLLKKKIGVPSATLRYLRAEGIVAAPSGVRKVGTDNLDLQKGGPESASGVILSAESMIED